MSAQHRTVGHWARSGLLILILLSLIGILPAVAGRGDAAASVQESAGEARFSELSAVPDFPTTITFRLAVESPEELVRAELLFAPRWVDTLNLIEAEIDPGDQLTVDFPLDMYQSYFPPGLDLLYRWRVTDAAGRETVSEEQVVLWNDTRFDWQELSTDQVSVFYYSSNQAFNQQILQSAQATIDEVQTDLGVERSRPIRLWIYNTREDFFGAQQPNSEAWFVGASYYGLYLILSVIPDGNEFELGRIVPHEVSHQVLYQAGENPFNLPARWFDEGIAVRNQITDKEGHEAVLQAGVEDGRLIPLIGLHRQFPFDDSYSLAYAQSLFVVEFIVAEWGESALAEIIDAYKDGISHDEAFRRGIGLTVQELDNRWRSTLGYDGDRPLDDGTGGPIGATSGGFGSGDPIAALVLGIALALTLTGAVIIRRSGSRPSRQRRSISISISSTTPSAGVIDRGILQ